MNGAKKRLTGRGRKKYNAQGMTETAVMVACIVAAIITIHVYVRRGYEGRIKQMADAGLGTQFDPAHGEYEKTSYQAGLVRYNVTYEQKSVDGSGPALYPLARQSIGRNGDAPMVSASMSRSTTGFNGARTAAPQFSGTPASGYDPNLSLPTVSVNYAPGNSVTWNAEPVSTTVDPGNQVQIINGVVNNMELTCEYKIPIKEYGHCGKCQEEGGWEKCEYDTNGDFTTDENSCRCSTSGNCSVTWRHYFKSRGETCLDAPPLTEWRQTGTCGTPPAKALERRCFLGGQQQPCPDYLPEV
jgi:hypothetical protein